MVMWFKNQRCPHQLLEIQDSTDERFVMSPLYIWGDASTYIWPFNLEYKWKLLWQTPLSHIQLKNSSDKAENNKKEDQILKATGTTGEKWFSDKSIFRSLVDLACGFDSCGEFFLLNLIFFINNCSYNRGISNDCNIDTCDWLAGHILLV